MTTGRGRFGSDRAGSDRSGDNRPGSARTKSDRSGSDRTGGNWNRTIVRFFFYLLGIFTLALGLTLSTKTKLGASAIIAVAFSVSEICGIRLGDATFLLYCFFILVEIILHLLPGRGAPSDVRGALIIDVLQLPFSIFFTRLLNIYAAWIPAPEHFSVRIAVLVLAIVLIGVGAALTLDMRLVASPGDGIVQAISDRSGLELGLTKNIVDITCVAFTCIFSLFCTRQIIGIGIGTLAGMLGTGRVIAVFNRTFGSWLIPLGKRDRKSSF